MATIEDARRYGVSVVALIDKNGAFVSPGEIDQTTPGTTNGVVLTDAAGHIVSQRATGKSISVQRPNDTSAYTAGDVIGTATGSTAAIEFTSMGPSDGGEFLITSASLQVDASALQSGEAIYRLALYNVTPPSAYGDNAAWDIPSGDRNAYLGHIDIGTPVDYGSTLRVSLDGINKQVTLLSGSIFAYPITLGAFTPTANTVRRFALHGIPL